MHKKLYPLICFLFLFSFLGLSQNNSTVNNDTTAENNTKTNKKYFLSDVRVIQNKYSFLSYKNIDTIFKNTIYYRNTYFNFILNTGNIGSLSIPLQFKPNLSFFIQKTDHFTSFYFDDKNCNFYNTTFPIVNLQYFNGKNRDDYVNISFIQNINQNWNIGFEYRRIDSEGYYQYQRNRVSNARIHANFISTSKKYFLFFTGYINNLKIRENGGIRYDSIFTKNIEPNRKGISVYLNNAKNQTDYKGFFIKQSLNLYSNPNSNIFLKNIYFHSKVNYKFQFQRYYDSNPDYTFYTKEHQFDTIGKYVQDQTFLYTFNHLYSLEFELPHHTHIIGSIQNQNIKYKDDIYNTTLKQTALSLEFIWFLINRLEYHFKYQTMIGRISKKKSNIYMNFNYKLDSNNWNINGEFEQIKRLPDINYWIYGNSSFQWNYKPLSENILYLKLKLTSQKLKFKTELHYYSIKNYTYFAKNKNPEQFNKLFSVVQLHGNKLLQWKTLFLNLNFGYQIFKDSIPLRIPKAYTFCSFYNQYSFQNNLIDLRFGIDVFYSLKYKTYNYLPLNRMLYLQDKFSFGDYPIINFFISGRIKNTAFFLKLAHVNQGFNGYNYMSIQNYPINDRQLQLGLQWIFKN